RALFNGLFEGESDEVQFERSGSFLATVRRLIDVPAVAEADEDLSSPDASGAEEGGDVLDAVPALTSQPAVPPAPTSPAASAAEGPHALRIGAEESPPSSELEAAPRSGSAVPGPHAILGLFAEMKVHRRDDGALVLEAPKEAAASLAALLRGVAAMLGPSGPT
ncbi:MAG TPA: hypothetical protein VE549_08110, partial [Myxococcaceae bacterium]|nr:hypothetical protein [Myxococcaceae bacterium]